MLRPIRKGAHRFDHTARKVQRARRQLIERALRGRSRISSNGPSGMGGTLTGCHNGEMTTTRFDGLCIIDADTHLTEPHDLWTSRAPKGYEDRVPAGPRDRRRADVDDGRRHARRGPARPAWSAPTAMKVPGTAFFQWNIEDVHAAALRRRRPPRADGRAGHRAQIVYPNTVGFGGQKFFTIEDETLRRLSVELYNDAMAEMQERSGGRLFPMAHRAVVGHRPRGRRDRAHAPLGLRGHQHHDRAARPRPARPRRRALEPDVGGVRRPNDLPINFHIGASDSSLAWFGSVPWPSLNGDQKLGLGSAMMYLNNAGVIGNLIYSGVLERYPDVEVRVGRERRRLDPVPARRRSTTRSAR